MAEIAEYREWLATGGTDRALIETVELSHPNWDTAVYLTNWDVVVRCVIQDSGAEREVEFQPARIQAEPAQLDDGTNQTTTATIAAYDGQIYSLLKKMTPLERRTPIRFRLRYYWSTDQSRQLINPSPIWSVGTTTATSEVVQGELQVSPLRAYRTGRYFTAYEFPILSIAR